MQALRHVHMIVLWLHRLSPASYSSMYCTCNININSCDVDHYYVPLQISHELVMNISDHYPVWCKMSVAGLDATLQQDTDGSAGTVVVPVSIMSVMLMAFAVVGYRYSVHKKLLL